MGSHVWLLFMWVLGIQTGVPKLVQRALLPIKAPPQLPASRTLRQGNVPGRRWEIHREREAEDGGLCMTAGKDPLPPEEMCEEGFPLRLCGRSLALFTPWVQTSRLKNCERTLSFPTKFVMTATGKKSNSPRAAPAFGIIPLLLNQDVTATEKFRADRLLQDESLLLFNKDFLAHFSHAEGTEQDRPGPCLSSAYN